MNFWDLLCRARMAPLHFLGFHVGHLYRCSEWEAELACPKCDFVASSNDMTSMLRSAAYHTATAHPEDQEFTDVGKLMLEEIIKIQKEEAGE